MLLKKREAGLLPAWKPPKKRSNWYGKLYKEQKQAANFILSRIRDSGGVGLFSEQGTGKTHIACAVIEQLDPQLILIIAPLDRKSTRLNSSHLGISYAVFCLKNKN